MSESKETMAAYRDDKIREAMGAQRLTIGALAEKAEVSEPTVAQVCNGKHVTTRTLEKVAGALGLKLRDLFDDEAA